MLKITLGQRSRTIQYPVLLIVVFIFATIGYHKIESLGNHTVHIFGTSGLTLKETMNDALMTALFYMVGVHIAALHKKSQGNFWQLYKLPCLGAIGGMVVPITIFLAVNWKHGILSAWPVPMATDIVLALTVLELYPSIIPEYVYRFVLLLAVFDDIGASLVVLFIKHDALRFWPCLSLFVLLNTLLFSSRLRIDKRLMPMLLPFLCFSWVFSGLQFELIGVLLGLFYPIPECTLFSKTFRAPDIQNVLETILKWGVIPLYLLINAGMNQIVFMLSEQSVYVFLGIVLGLCLGKPIGIMLCISPYLLVQRTHSPDRLCIGDALVASTICGIGFTMSTYLIELTLQKGLLMDVAKQAVFFAALLSFASATLIVLVLKVLQNDKHALNSNGSHHNTNP